MNLLLITFALRNPLKDYTPFFVEIRGNAINWSHYIDQTMIISTFLTARQLGMKLNQLTEDTDSLLVTPITDITQLSGRLPGEAWEWMRSVFEAKKLLETQEGIPPIPNPLLKK